MSQKNPFKFLDSYTRDDRDLFYGRDQELDEIYRKFYKSLLLLVYGKSGTGKSSIINCGLASRIPAEDVLLIPVRCGKDPVNNLKADLRKHTASGAAETLDILQEIHEQHFKPMALVFDQFEEIFILSTAEERRKLVAELKAILQSRLRVNLVLIFREEYFAGFSEFEEEIPHLYENRVRIGRLNRAMVEEIIEKPCRTCRVAVGPGVSKRIAGLLSKDTGEIELTWFQILMDKLYKRALERDPGMPEIRLDDLEEAGDIGNILGDFLNEQLLSMKNPAEVEAVLKTMISEDGTKRRLTREEIQHAIGQADLLLAPDRVRDILQALVDRRIISEKDENGHYEIRHDSLAQRINDRLTADERKLKEIAMLVKNAHQQYLQVGTMMNEQALKYIGPFLDDLELPSDLKYFVSNCITTHKQRQRRSRKQWGLAGLVLFSLMLSLTIWALIERHSALRDKYIARIQTRYANQSMQLLEVARNNAENANRNAVLARDTAIRAMQIAQDQLYRNIRNSLSISSLNMNVVYVGVDNPISIAASGIDQGKVFPYAYEKNDKLKKNLITKVGKIFIIRNIPSEAQEIIIGAHGMTTHGETIHLGDAIFRVKKLRVPYVSVGKGKITGGNIEKDFLNGIDQIDLNVETDYNIQFRISGFQMSVYDDKGEKTSESSNDNRFTTEQKEIIKNSENGNICIIDHITVNSFDNPPEYFQPLTYGNLQTLTRGRNIITGGRELDQVLYFRIGGDLIDRQNEKDRVFNRLLELGDRYKSEKNADEFYYIAKSAYTYDTNNKKGIKTLLDAYSLLQDEFLSTLPFDKTSRDWKFVDFNKIAILYNTVSEKSGESKFEGLQQFAKTFPDLQIKNYDNGIFLIDGKNKKLIPQITTKRTLKDVVFLKANGQYALLTKDPTEILIYDQEGKIQHQIIPSNSDAHRLFCSTNEMHLIATSLTGLVLHLGKYDGRTCLIRISDGSQSYLWGYNYKGKTTDNLQFNNNAESIKIYSDQDLILATFPYGKRIEAWDHTGTMIHSEPIDGKPWQIIVTPNHKIFLSTQQTIGGKEVFALSSYDLNLVKKAVPGNLPIEADWISFTSDGRYIIMQHSHEFSIFDFQGNLAYTVNNMPSVWRVSHDADFTISDGNLRILSDRDYAIYPITNVAKNIIINVEEKQIFGRMPVISYDLKRQIDQILFSSTH